MDKDNNNNFTTNIQHFLSNKTKNSRNNSTRINPIKKISGTDEKFIANNKFRKSINENTFNLIINNKRNNFDILYNDLQSPKSHNTIKSILKNKNIYDSSFNLKKKKNVNKKNTLNTILNKSINQNSNEISDYSYSCLFRKDNDSQDIISNISKKKVRNKKITFLKKNEKKLERANSNPNKIKAKKMRKFLIKNNKQISFSDFEEESRISSDLSNKFAKSSLKKVNRGKKKYNSAINLLNLKEQKYYISLNEKRKFFHKNSTFTKKSPKKKRKKSDDSYEINKKKKIKFKTYIDFKFDKSILLDIVNKSPKSNYKGNIMDIITMDKVSKDLKQSIIKIDKDALKKELHDFETNDICDAIEKLPDNNLFVNTNNNRENTSNKTKNINIKNIQNFNSKTKINYNYGRYRCLYHKGLVYDSFDDEENDDTEIYLVYISPNSNFAYLIDSIVLISSFIQIFYLPIFLASNSDYCRNKFGINKILFYCIDIIYIIDLITEFFRSYYNFEELLVNNIIEISKNYLNGWFLLDLIEAIPFYIILHMMENDCELNSIHHSKYYSKDINKLQYTLLILKTFKIFKVISENKILKIVEKIFEEIDFLFTSKNVLFTIFLFFNSINITSCLFIFFGRNSYPGWIVKCNLQNESFINIYITAVYYLITTMTTVGYGDIIVSSSLTEKFFQIFVLIVGTVFYSWIVTYISNYIKKNNEKYLDYEQKVSILEEIKISHPKLTQDLYNKIKRYLQYNKFKEQNNNEILINYLPYTLKKILFLEMYKPIIKNFNLLKSAENSNFIIKVVTSFKSGLSIKGDILIQEGDLIEDIIFVKNGTLSIEVGIDMNCEKESIQDHLNYFNDKKEKMKINNINIENIGAKNSFHSNNNNLINSFSKIYNQKNKTLTEISENNNIKYLKVICIRKNEHFGDILMFLNERAPFHVKVKSKMAELFYLNKTDAIEISSFYPNIWNRIIKKSLYNMKKIKQTTKKLLIFYSKMNDIILNDQVSNNKKEKNDKNSEIIEEKSTIESKKNIKNKLIISEKKKKESNKCLLIEDNNCSTLNNDNKNILTEKIKQTNSFEIDPTINDYNCPEIEKIEKKNQNNNNINVNLQNKETNNNDTESNKKTSDEWFKNFLIQDRIINCELFPNEKLIKNKYLKNDSSSGTEKEFTNLKIDINNYDDEKANKPKKLNTFFTDLSISHISTTTIYSSYDNLNEITKYKFYKDLTLQVKIKQFLLDECFPKLHILNSNINSQSAKNNSQILKTNNSIINSKFSKTPVNKNSKSFDLLLINNSISKDRNSQLIDSNLKNRSQCSLKNYQRQDHLNSCESVRSNKYKRNSLIFRSANLSNLVKKNNIRFNSLEKFKEIEKRDEKKFKSAFIDPFSKRASFIIRRKSTVNNQNERKKINYLSVISHNIYENRQALKNPCEFYAGFFANIIEKQKNISKKSKKFSKNFKNLNSNDKIVDNYKIDNNKTDREI